MPDALSDGYQYYEKKRIVSPSITKRSLFAHTRTLTIFSHTFDQCSRVNTTNTLLFPNLDNLRLVPKWRDNPSSNWSCRNLVRNGGLKDSCPFIRDLEPGKIILRKQDARGVPLGYCLDWPLKKSGRARLPSSMQRSYDFQHPAASHPSQTCTSYSRQGQNRSWFSGNIFMSRHARKPLLA